MLSKLKNYIKRISTIGLATITLMTSINLSGLNMVNTYAATQYLPDGITYLIGPTGITSTAGGINTYYKDTAAYNHRDITTYTIGSNNIPCYAYNTNDNYTQSKGYSWTMVNKFYFNAGTAITPYVTFGGSETSSIDTKTICFRDSSGTDYTVAPKKSIGITKSDTYTVIVQLTGKVGSKNSRTQRLDEFYLDITSGGHTHGRNTWHKTGDQSCTSAEKGYYTCVCGYKYTEETRGEKNAHSYG